MTAAIEQELDPKTVDPDEAANGKIVSLESQVWRTFPDYEIEKDWWRKCKGRRIC